MAYLKNPFSKKLTKATNNMTFSNITTAVAVPTTGATSTITTGNGFGYTTLGNGQFTGHLVGAAGSTTTRQRPAVAPVNWKTIKIKNNVNALDMGEVFESPLNGQPTWVGSLSLSSSAARHHWELFKKLHPSVDFLLCGIPDCDPAPYTTVTNVLFTKQQDAELFENWLAGYSENFEDRSELYSTTLPVPPTTMNYSHQVRMRDHESLVDLSHWLFSNCQNKVYSLGGMLFFLSDEDAMLYKMAFTK